MAAGLVVLAQFLSGSVLDRDPSVGVDPPERLGVVVILAELVAAIDDLCQLAVKVEILVRGDHVA